MDWAFDRVTGRLHPGVGIAAEARISVNFGTDLHNKPFKWVPGNTLDFDADWKKDLLLPKRTLSFAA